MIITNKILKLQTLMSNTPKKTVANYYYETLPLLQATQLLLILSICKVNGISFRHDISGYVTGEGIPSSLFEPIPTDQPTPTTTGFELSHLTYGPFSNSIDPIDERRFLKQYEVNEDHGDADDLFHHPHQHQTHQQEIVLQTPKTLSQFFYPTAHLSSQLLYPDPQFPFLSDQGLEYDSFTTNLPQVKSQLTKNHGPIALGMLL